MSDELLVTALVWALWSSAVLSVLFIFLFLVWLACRVFGFVLKTLLRWTFDE